VSDMSNYLERQVYEWMRGTAMPSAPAAIYLGLFTVAPGESSAGTEVTGGSYARQAVTLPASSAPGDGSGANSAIINFPTASGSWGTVVAVGIFDAVSGGNLLMYKTVTNFTVSSGESARVDASGLTVTFN
jgi:hypothetical protein